MQLAVALFEKHSALELKLCWENSTYSTFRGISPPWAQILLQPTQDGLGS